MTLNLKSFDTFVSDQITAIESSQSLIQDFSPGSIIRAIVDTSSANAMFLQAQNQRNLAIARLTTSAGADLDSFVQQFGLERLPAAPASVVLTFSRFSPVTQAFIQVGAQASSSFVNGAVFAVIADTENQFFNQSLNGYTVPAGIVSIEVPALAINPGSASNVPAGFVNTIDSVIIGVDTVTNNQAAAGGADSETDSALRQRFVDFFDGLSKATKQALSAAIESVQNGLVFNLIENMTPQMEELLGFFYAVVDDGSGNPPQDLINRVGAALDATRAFTIRYAAIGPEIVNIDIAATLTITNNITQAAAIIAVTNAFTNFFSTSGFGSFFPFSRLCEIIYDASPEIINVTNTLLNGGTADLQNTNNQIFRLNNLNLSFING